MMRVSIKEIKGTNTLLTTKQLKFIRKIGVELEGGWDEPPDNLHNDASLREIDKHIGSPIFLCEKQDHNCHTCVPHRFAPLEQPTSGTYCPDNCSNPQYCTASCDKSCSCNFQKRNLRDIGECISPPMDIEELRSWIDMYAPDIVNDSCGLHVHVSLKTEELI